MPTANYKLLASSQSEFELIRMNWSNPFLHAIDLICDNGIRYPELYAGKKGVHRRGPNDYSTDLSPFEQIISDCVATIWWPNTDHNTNATLYVATIYIGTVYRIPCYYCMTSWNKASNQILKHCRIATHADMIKFHVLKGLTSPTLKQYLYYSISTVFIWFSRYNDAGSVVILPVPGTIRKPRLNKKG